MSRRRIDPKIAWPEFADALDRVRVAAKEECVPLCGARKAYGRFDRPWKHEPQCPVRLAWEGLKPAQEKLPDSLTGDAKHVG